MKPEISRANKSHFLRYAMPFGVIATAAGLAACSSSPPQPAPRPANMRYVGFESWRIDPSKSLSVATGAVAVKGDQEAKGKPQCQWTKAVVMAVQKKELDKALQQPGARIAEAFSDPGGHIHIGELTAGESISNNPNNDNQEILVTMIGGSETKIQLGARAANGQTELVQTQNISGPPVRLTAISEIYPGAAVTAVTHC